MSLKQMQILDSTEAVKQERPAPCARHCEANAFQIVIKNLKAQLAQPEQEPVATVTSETGADITMSWWHEPALPIGTKLYTTPPQRTWVWLTDDEIDNIYMGAGKHDLIRARKIEAKLKEKNT